MFNTIEWLQISNNNFNINNIVWYWCTKHRQVIVWYCLMGKNLLKICLKIDCLILPNSYIYWLILKIYKSLKYCLIIVWKMYTNSVIDHKNLKLQSQLRYCLIIWLFDSAKLIYLLINIENSNITEILFDYCLKNVYKLSYWSQKFEIAKSIEIMFDYIIVGYIVCQSWLLDLISHAYFN